VVYSNVYEMSPSRRERTSRNTNNGNDQTVEFSLLVIGWACTISHLFITGMFRMRYQSGPTRGAVLHGQQYGISLDDCAMNDMVIDWY